MSDDLLSLKVEVAKLRHDLEQLRQNHCRLLRQVGVWLDLPEDTWPDFLAMDVSALGVRDDQMKIPILLKAEGDRGRVIFQDEKLRQRAEISIDKDGARFEMRNRDGNLIFQLAEAEDGSGQMCVCDKDGHPRAGLRVNEFGGVVNVIDKHGKAQAVMLGTDEGGEIFAANAMHHSGAALKATAHGGVVSVHEPSGQLMGYLSANTDMGLVAVHGPHGAVAAQMGAAEEGGVVVMYDIEGTIRQKLP